MTNPKKTRQRRKNVPEEMVNQLANSVLELSDGEILAEELSSGGDPVEAADYVRSVLRGSSAGKLAGVHGLRKLMQQIRSLEVDSHSLLRFLTDTVERFQRETGISAHFLSELDEIKIPQRICRELVRIVQEGLVNVRKHRRAKKVLVQLAGDPDRWLLTLEDNGRGLPFAGRFSQDELEAMGKGLLMIRQRVRLIGGELTVESTPSGGSRLEISVPQGRQVLVDTHKPPIRIVIADDHPIFRDGLRRLLEARAGIKVVGEACGGAEAVKLVRQLKPDILLLDLAMPQHPGLEALRELSTGQQSNPVRVILLTASAEKSQIVEALQLGARGVVLKDSATQLLLKSINTVMMGEYWVGRESVSDLVQYLRTQMQESQEYARRRKYGLTPREMEIVSAVVAGYSNREISQHFRIAEDTVKHHMTNIFDKLGVSTRLELALFAVNQSLPIASMA